MLSARRRGRRAALVSAAAVATVGAGGPVFAWVDAQTGGRDARAPLVAVSDTGSASGECFTAGQSICLTGQEGVLAASGTGTATGGTAASATGAATATSPGWGIPAVAVTGVALSGGCSTASTGYGTDAVAVSGTGCATATTNSSEGYAIGLSGVGDASGTLAVSLGGNATGGPTRTTCAVPLVGGCAPAPGAAVSGTRNANANGGPVAVGGGDATAYGGLVAVSATGSARGGSVLNVGGGGCGC